MLREKEQLVALNLESTYGEAATITGAHAIMAQNVNVKVLEGDSEENNALVGHLGNQGKNRVNTYCSVEFEVFLFGSGSAGTAPQYSMIYNISSHADVVTAGTAVDYTIASGDTDSATVSYFVGEHLHQLTGVRGTIQLDFSTKGLPKLMFKGKGLYNEPEKVVGGLSGVNFASVLAPLPFTKEFVPTFTLLGQTVDAESCSFDQNMPAEFLALIAKEEIVQPDRNSTLTIKFREPDLATFDWFEAARQNARGVFALQHGVDATHEGRIFELDAPVVELDSCERSFDKVAMLTVTLNIIATSKGSDYTFAHR